MENKNIIIAVAALIIGLFIGTNLRIGYGTASSSNLAATNYTQITASEGIRAYSGGVYVDAGGVTVDAGGLTVSGGTSALGTLTSVVTTISGLFSQTNTNATTTGTTNTLKASDMTYSTMLINPIVGATTITLPTATTLSSYLETTGQRTKIVVYNATTTAAATITFAGNTGVTFQGSTSTALLAGGIDVWDVVRTGASSFVVSSHRTNYSY